MKNEKIESLKNKIEELETSLFYINMIDHWTDKDKELYDKYYKELQEIKDLLVKEIAESVK